MEYSIPIVPMDVQASPISHVSFGFTRYFMLECSLPCRICFVAGFRQMHCVSLLDTNNGCVQLMCLNTIQEILCYLN